MVLLLVKGDPKGYEEKAALEREVNGLESYLEAMPSLVVLAYLKRANPEFLDGLGLFSFWRPFLQTCFTMTLFLRSGPCSILPRKGIFGGIFNWRFIAVFCLNQLSFNFKFVKSQFDGETYIANAVSVSTLGVVLGLVSIRRAVGSWKTVLGLILKFPPLLFLPVFGFVTFGFAPKGEAGIMRFDLSLQSKDNFSFAGEGLAMNLRWTWVNFVSSLLINRLRFLHNIGLYNLHEWITVQPGAGVFDMQKSY